MPTGRKSNATTALARYREVMDNLAKYARAEADAVMSGNPWDESGLTLAVLQDAERAFRELVREYRREHPVK
jgi:hypothetical protein